MHCYCSVCGFCFCTSLSANRSRGHVPLLLSLSGILNFCANNYLGLSSHPEVVQAGIEALKTYGAGLSSVRFICGTQVKSLMTCTLTHVHTCIAVFESLLCLQDLHKNLERKLAEFHEREDCILYASCFDANAGLFEVLLGPDDAVLSEELNHASIIDGIRLCRAQRLRYKHMDLGDLEKKLKESQVCADYTARQNAAFQCVPDRLRTEDVKQKRPKDGALGDSRCIFCLLTCKVTLGLKVPQTFR